MHRHKDIGDAAYKFTWEARYHTATITVKPQALQAVFIFCFPLKTAGVAVCASEIFETAAEFACFEITENKSL